MSVAKVSTVMQAGPLLTQLRRWFFQMSGYNKLGLYCHDLLYETPDVEEAIRRLPADKLDERMYRMTRALQLDTMKIILPKEEWISFEDDMENGRYLRGLLDQVVFERKEREQWQSK